MKIDQTLRNMFLTTVKEVANDIAFSVAHRVWGNDITTAADYVLLDFDRAQDATPGGVVDMEIIRHGEIWDVWANEAFDLVVAAMKNSLDDELSRIKKIREHSDDYHK